MPDEIDRLIDAEAYAEEHSEKKKIELSDTDKALLDEGGMTKAAAVELTDSIRASATATYILVKRAHDGKAWKALGYDTWSDYVIKEFDMTTSRSYQLLNQANVIKELEAVVPEGAQILLTEKEARDIKNELPRITNKVKEQTKDLSKEQAAQKVSDIVKETRKEKKEERDAIKAEKEDRVQEDSFAGLDSKRQPSPDRLSSSNSGSTADDAIDLNADISPVDADFASSDTSDDVNDDVWSLQYVFSSISSLGNPYDIAKKFSGDNKVLATNVKNAIKWLTDFQKFIK